jgi:hypothetical protein
LATDSVNKSEETITNRSRARTLGAGKLNFQEQLKLYNDVPFWVITDLADCVCGRLSDYRELFGDGYCITLGSGALARIAADRPDVNQEFNLSRDKQNGKEEMPSK